MTFGYSPRFRPLVLTGAAGSEAVRRVGVTTLTWADFLLGALPRHMD